MLSTKTADKYLYWAELTGLVITIALLPIDRMPYLHKIPLHLGLFSVLLLALSLVARLTSIALEKRYQDLKKYLTVGLVLLLPLIGYLISTFFAIDKSFASSATAILAVVVFRAYAFYVILSEKPDYWKLIKSSIYIVTSVVVLFGLFQLFFDVWGAHPSVTDLRSCCTSNSTYTFPRVHSTALEPLYFDHYLMLPLWLLVFDFWRNDASRESKSLILLFVSSLSLFILTIARSATIGIVVAALIFFFATRRQSGFKVFVKYMTRLLAAAFVVSACLVIMSGIATIFIDKHAQYKGTGFGSLELFGGHFVDVNDGSAQTRYKMWPKVISNFAHHPLVGVGPDNSRIEINSTDYNKGIKPEKLQPFNNDLLGLISDLGLISIVTFGPIVYIFFRGIYRLYKDAWRHPSAALALVVVGMVIQGNFFQSLLLTRFWVVVGLLLVAIYPARNAIIKNE